LLDPLLLELLLDELLLLLELELALLEPPDFEAALAMTFSPSGRLNR
jgi:hypothetical protein